MALPGLSFEIVRTSAPVGIRADQTAILALTERGPAETPTLVHSFDEFTDQFGAALPGTLGALAAQGYYDNGGEQLIVTRFVPAEAVAAIGALPVVGADPKQLGQTPTRTTTGTLDVTSSPTVFTVSGLSLPLLPSDVSTPVTLTAGGSPVTATITGVATGGATITVATGPSAAPALHPGSATLMLPATVPLVASGPGAFGNDVQVQTTLSLRRRAGGTLNAAVAQSYPLTLTTPVLPSDACAPARLVVQPATGPSPVVQWGTIVSVGTGGMSLTFAPGPPAPGFPPAPATLPATAYIEVYDPTFSLTILEPARANVVVNGLDLRRLDLARGLLAGTSVTIPEVPWQAPLPAGAPLPTAELPLPGIASLYCGVDGLGALPPNAATATWTIPVVGATPHAPALVLQLEADQPGTGPNGITVATSLTGRRFGPGAVVEVFPDDRLHLHGLLAEDEGYPVEIAVGTPPVTIWGKVKAPSKPGRPPVFVPGTPGALAGVLPGYAAIRVYEPTFTLTVTYPVVAGVPPTPTQTVTGLDLRNIDAARTSIARTGLTIPNGVVNSMDVELPAAGPVTFTPGSDGTPIADRVLNLSLSFQRCIDALEIVEQPPLLPDVVIAPDLWSSIWGTKGLDFLAFDGATATGLADQMVLSAWRTSDRVVIVDPPLQASLQPFSPADLVAWQAQRYASVGPSAASGPLAGAITAGTDFAATFTPWVQIVAGGTYRGDDTLLMPPSAYVAGQMAQNARQQGPWIATGNVALEDVVGLDALLSIQDQEALQAVGISPLRVDLPQGATIQGVRSLSWPYRLSWGYLSTRRLFNFLRRALLPIGLSYVFEPNTPPTWYALRRDLTRVLNDIFLRGGFAGSTPSDGFFVKIDATLNPQSNIDAGILTAQIGVAPAIPLEFLVVLLVLQNNTATVTEAPP
jgi:hypothetical protein